MLQASIDPDDIQKITIDSYNSHIDEYLDKRAKATIRTAAFWPGVEYFLSQLKPGQTILEIGSGAGVDANTIEQLGFKVVRSDVAKAFLELQDKRGNKAELYDVLKSAYPKKFSAIFANAVLLHFNEQQFQKALNNIRSSLLPNGLLCIGMKLGDFEGLREEGLSSKRYFKFWRLEKLEEEFTRAHFKILNSFVTPLKDFVVITVAHQA